MKKMHIACAAGALLFVGATVSAARANTADMPLGWYDDAQPLPPHALFCPFPEQVMTITASYPTAMPIVPPTSTTIDALTPLMRIMNGLPPDFVAPGLPQASAAMINVVPVPPVCDTMPKTL